MAAAHGMDAGGYTFAYVAGWAGGDLTCVRQAAETVTKAARRITSRCSTDTATVPDDLTATAWARRLGSASSWAQALRLTCANRGRHDRSGQPTPPGRGKRADTQTEDLRARPCEHRGSSAGAGTGVTPTGSPSAEPASTNSPPPQPRGKSPQTPMGRGRLTGRLQVAGGHPRLDEDRRGTVIDGVHHPGLPAADLSVLAPLGQQPAQRPGTPAGR